MEDPLPAALPTPAPARAAGPHLLDQLALEGEAPTRGDHAGGPCTAELVLRRRPGADRVVVEFAGLDRDCPACRELGGSLQALRDRWF